MSHFVGDACAGGHRAQTERQFSDAVVELARLCHWLVHRDPTWRATGADAGYPDLTLVGPLGQVIFAELKVGKGKRTPSQEEWARRLLMRRWQRQGVDYYLWRPSDWPEIERVLT